jgi:hypothetical protein
MLIYIFVPNYICNFFHSNRICINYLPYLKSLLAKNYLMCIFLIFNFVLNYVLLFSHQRASYQLV